MAMEISRSLAGHEEGTRRRMGLAVWGFAYPGTISDEAIGMWVGEMFSHEYKGNWGSMWWPGGTVGALVRCDGRVASAWNFQGME